MKSHRHDHPGAGRPGHGPGHRGHRHGPGHGHGWGRDGGPDERRGGRRRRVFDSGELRLVLLQLIGEQPRHGYELIRALEAESGGLYVPSPGMIYPTLTMLQEMGHIAEAASPAGAAGSGRKPFALTEAGSAELAERGDEIAALRGRLAELAASRARTEGGPIRRALQNLKTVLVERFERPDVAPDTLHQAAAILDEAAQRIERL